jgi:hypothetical protein
MRQILPPPAPLPAHNAGGHSALPPLPPYGGRPLPPPGDLNGALFPRLRRSARQAVGDGHSLRSRLAALVSRRCLHVSPSLPLSAIARVRRSYVAIRRGLWLRSVVPTFLVPPRSSARRDSLPLFSPLAAYLSPCGLKTPQPLNNFRLAFRSAGRAIITFERRNLLQNSACVVFISLLRVFRRARFALPARRSPSPMPAYSGRAQGAAAVAPPLGAGLPFIPSPYSQAAFGSSSHSVSGFARVPRFAPAASGER